MSDELKSLNEGFILSTFIGLWCLLSLSFSFYNIIFSVGGRLHPFALINMSVSESSLSSLSSAHRPLKLDKVHTWEDYLCLQCCMLWLLFPPLFAEFFFHMYRVGMNNGGEVRMNYWCVNCSFCSFSYLYFISTNCDIFIFVVNGSFVFYFDWLFLFCIYFD